MTWGHILWHATEQNPIPMLPQKPACLCRMASLSKQPVRSMALDLTGASISHIFSGVRAKIPQRTSIDPAINIYKLCLRVSLHQKNDNTWINMDKHGGYSHDFPIFPTMSWASNKKKVTEAFTRIPCGAAGWSMNQSRLGGHGLEDHLEKKTSTINIQQHQSTILYIGVCVIP